MDFFLPFGIFEALEELLDVGLSLWVLLHHRMAFWFEKVYYFSSLARSFSHGIRDGDSCPCGIAGDYVGCFGNVKK